MCMSGGGGGGQVQNIEVMCQLVCGASPNPHAALKTTCPIPRTPLVSASTKRFPSLVMRARLSQLSLVCFFFVNHLKDTYEEKTKTKVRTVKKKKQIIIIIITQKQKCFFFFLLLFLSLRIVRRSNTSQLDRALFFVVVVVVVNYYLSFFLSLTYTLFFFFLSSCILETNRSHGKKKDMRTGESTRSLKKKK